MVDPHVSSSGPPASAVHRDQLQQLQYSHFHHPYPSTHHPYTQIQQQERQQSQHPFPMPQHPGHPAAHALSPRRPPGHAYVASEPAAPDAHHAQLGPGHAPSVVGHGPFSSSAQPPFQHSGNPHFYQQQQQHQVPVPADPALSALSPAAGASSSTEPRPSFPPQHSSEALNPSRHAIPDSSRQYARPDPIKAGPGRRTQSSAQDLGPALPLGEGIRSAPLPSASEAFYPHAEAPVHLTPLAPGVPVAGLPPAVPTDLHMHNATVPTRKQNQSCDNCRRRKIACRPPAAHFKNPHRRCAHCYNKGVPCTHDYVNRVQGAKIAAEAVKKPRHSRGRTGSGRAAEDGSMDGAQRDSSSTKEQASTSPSADARPRWRRSASLHTNQSGGPHAAGDEDMDDHEGGSQLSDTSAQDRIVNTRQERALGSLDPSSSVPPRRVDAPSAGKRMRQASSSGSAHRPSKMSRSADVDADAFGKTNGPRLHPTAQLIRYLLSPSEDTFVSSSASAGVLGVSATTSPAASSYFPNPLRLPIPTAAARRLAYDAKLRSEVLHDFVESFLMIVNPRFAVLDARRVRAGIYPFEELVLESGKGEGDEVQVGEGSSELARPRRRRRRHPGQRWKHAEEYLYRSDTDGEQDDGGLPSCAPATRPHRDQHIASAPRQHRSRSAASASLDGSVASAAMSSREKLERLRPRPLPDVLIAVVLAFGAKFSSHAILGSDRAESAVYLRKAWDLCREDALSKSRSRLAKPAVNGDGDGSGRARTDQDADMDSDDDVGEESLSEYAHEPSILHSGRSTIAKSLLIKAQDVLEKRRAFALPTLTNVQAALLMEPLFDQGVRLDDHKRGTPKWEVLAELLQQVDEEDGALVADQRQDGQALAPGSGSRSSDEMPKRSKLDMLDERTKADLLRTAAERAARTRGADQAGSQPSLDFCGFWHSVALRHLLELRLHEADYVSTLCDIDILTARRLDYFGETEIERRMLEDKLKGFVKEERQAMGKDGVESATRNGGNAVVRRGEPLAPHRLDALEAAIGATNSLGTLAQSAWWLASTSDAITSAFFRKRPLMRPEEMLGGHVPSDAESDNEDEEEPVDGPAPVSREATGAASAAQEERATSPAGVASSDQAAPVKSTRERSTAQSSSRSSNTLSGSGSGSGSATASGHRRKLRKLNTGGITREAGPDPYEGSDESEDENAKEETPAPASRAVGALVTEDRAAMHKSSSASSVHSEMTSISDRQRRTHAKREKLALLGERVSLPEKDSYQIWYSGISELCKIHRLMWDTLWSPRARARGVHLVPLRDIQRRTERWRKTYLPKMGVPYDAVVPDQGAGGGISVKAASWPKEWDFIAASTANMLSINSFALDILMWQAVEDHGIAEANGAEGDSAQGAATVAGEQGSAKDARDGPEKSGQEGQLSAAAQAERSVCNNALSASLRIAALVEVLRANYYLRLDPNILHFTIHAAGQFLATYDNPAVYAIIDGLKQYGLSYEEGLEQADQLAAYAAAARIPRPKAGAAHVLVTASRVAQGGHEQEREQAGAGPGPGSMPSSVPNGALAKAEAVAEAATAPAGTAAAAAAAEVANANATTAAPAPAAAAAAAETVLA